MKKYFACYTERRIFLNSHQNHAPAVENMQRYLRQLSYDEPTIPAPPIDGIFESRTENALREFQRLRGFPVTGSANRTTWDRLYADYRAALAFNSPPRQISVFPLEPTGYVMVSGSGGFAVAAVQHMLLELHHHYSELSDVIVTGIYDEQTVNAIRTFQKKSGLPVDGNVGLLTWNALADQYNILFSRTTDE